MIEPSRRGYRKCQNCGKRFVSEDVELLRHCLKCSKNLDERQPRVVHIADAGHRGSQ